MTTQTPLYSPQPRFDLLSLPILGRWLKWRWGRLSLQIPMVVLTLALLWDGFTGPSQASRNLATVGAWVHYRGLVVVALLFVGNLFCMACPFTLPRTLAKRLSSGGVRFPKVLRNKWLAIMGIVTLFFLYEWLDLWASPALTAWVIVFYFVGSFVLEVVFTESAFCKYVCPLGSFNMVYSTLSPTQIGVKNASVCASCSGKECVNGRYAPQTLIHFDQIPVLDAPTPQTQSVEVVHSPQGTLGCGTLLYAPYIQSNHDCTLCLDCVRACPHDNASLFLRSSNQELSGGVWAKRWDVSLLVIMLAFMGVTNAFGMVPPVYALQQWLSDTLHTSDFMNLALIFSVGNVVLPIGVAVLGAQLTQWVTRSRASLRDIVSTFAPSFVPIGFGIWFAHYGFHFLIAPFSIIPVFQEFLGGTGDWARWSIALDAQWIGLIQVVALIGGFGWSMWLAQQASAKAFKRDGVIALAIWGIILLGLMLVALSIFSLPMEMRGTNLLG